MEILGFMVILLIFSLPVILIALIISAVVKRNSNKEVDFESIMRTIYTYIVLIASLFLIVFAIICIFNNAIGYFVPEETSTTQAQNLVWLITSLAELVVGLPIFIYHSKLAKRI